MAHSRTNANSHSQSVCRLKPGMSICILSVIHVMLIMCTFQLSKCSENVETTAAPPDMGAGDDKTGADKAMKDGVEEPSTSKPALTFDRLYAEGVRAYDTHLWYSCANKMEKAIQDYKSYKQVLTNCRLDCSKGVRPSKMSNLSSSLEDFSVFAKFLKDADCFRRCKDDSLNTHPRVSERLLEAFEKRMPYQYLQFCYFKLDRVKQAASACYTFFLANPDDVDTRQNIRFYREKALVADSEFLDLEMVPYKEHYIRAMMAHAREDWPSVISQIESSLVEYYKEIEVCYANCQSHVKFKGSELSTTVADSLISFLTCKLNCEEQLSIVYTEPIDFFLQDMYHYTQYAYYQEGDLEKSAEATASLLALNSSHKIMKDNKDLLADKLGYREADFIPRKEVAEYAATRKEMQDMMDFINKNYRWADGTEEETLDEDVTDVLDRMIQNKEEPDDWMSRYEQLGMHIIAKSTDLNREERFVTDGLLKPEQCEELLVLTKDLKPDPHGSMVYDLKLAQKMLELNPNEDYETSLRLLIRAVEVVRHYTQRYLDPNESLYLKYTSIVCWTQPEDSEYLAGCYPQEDGTCIKFSQMSDELYSDGYTTVTYLNTADEDSDFLFLNEKRGVDSSFGIKCGRTVGFNTGDRHALKVPKQASQRCALVIRFTIYRSDDEREYRDTIDLLHRVDELRFASAAQSGKEVLENFEKKGVKIVKTGKELQGKERFVADGLASDAQCSTLRNMVMSGALVGDGYDHLSSKPSFISPHTEHEMYQGITIYRASKLMHQGMISTFGMQAFLDLSENSRLLVEKYFNLTRPLHFDYTHLVCRTAIDDNKNTRQDLSHPVHADNCVLQPDGSCTKDYPAFTQRDYSAILYLNTDFEGGEFFFAHANKSEQVSIRPKCGRIVGFNAGDFHGVRAVKSGQRCALALWFTHNANFKELAHVQARKTLQQVEAEQKSGIRTAKEEL